MLRRSHANGQRLAGAVGAPRSYPQAIAATLTSVVSRSMLWA